MHRTKQDAQVLRCRRGLLALCAVTAICVLGGCGGGQDDSTALPATQTSAAEIDLQHPLIRIDTNLGAIVVRLDGDRAPGTVRNFLNYMNEDFYNNTLVHYVAPDTMIVGGGYTADGQLKSPTQPPIRNEAHNGWKNVRGTIAMARDAAAGIDSATSQFFINLSDAPTLDHRGTTPDEYGYCVFGEVTEGLDVADKISRAATRDRGGELAQSPDPPVVIQSIEFES
jgi:cyclophilin family peptidyl-prolyl cis-trans isomerase